MNISQPLQSWKWTGLLCLLVSCTGYMHRNAQVQQHIMEGNIEKAYTEISDDNKWEKGRNRLLYYLNRGALANLLGKYEESIKYLQKADYYYEDYRKTAAEAVLSTVTNPMLAPYKGEDFEEVMLHYYQAMNYIMLGDYENALVECRRMTLTLNRLDDKYKDPKTGKSNLRYQHDAFANNLIGLIYDASGDYNNAFIAYRNAYDIYEGDYRTLFGIGAPGQLKQDLMRAAYRTGFRAELKQYEAKFGYAYVPDTTSGGELVFFWNNGLGPLKGQFDITFTIIRGEGGWATFNNTQYGFSFPVYIGSAVNDPKSGFSQLEVVRAAFPKYIERQVYYDRSWIAAAGDTAWMQPVEDINAIAFKALEDRFLRETGQTLLRLSLKKASEYALREANKDAGAALGLINAFTESADIRNWQSLPHTVSYARLKLPAGQQKVSMQYSSTRFKDNSQATFTFDIRKGKTAFFAYHTLRSAPHALNAYWD